MLMVLIGYAGARPAATHLGIGLANGAGWCEMDQGPLAVRGRAGATPGGRNNCHGRDPLPARPVGGPGARRGGARRGGPGPYRPRGPEEERVTAGGQGPAAGPDADPGP